MRILADCCRQGLDFADAMPWPAHHVHRPDLVLLPVGIGWVDFIVEASPLIAIIFTAVCVAFIPNAFNTADGANGLVAGTSALALLWL